MPDRQTRETASAGETEALGAALASELRPGDVVLLSGEVGTGKTTFVRGACRALGVSEPVRSPTFMLARRYLAGMAVSHLDLYRLAGGLAGEVPGLLADYTGPEDIVFVEWPERAASWPGEVRARVRLRHLGDDRRRVEIEE